MTVVFAMILDAMFGEPRWLWDRAPHPAVIMGRLIGWGDARFNAGPYKKAKGAIWMLSLVMLAIIIGGAIIALPGHLADIIVGAILIAQRSLVDHVRAVADALRMSPQAGKRSVAMIVGRDTANMTAPDIARAAIESAAENFSDGITAPVFWFALFGLPGLLVYKITNTADSMIGYRTPRHAEFGYAAAKCDDLLNYLPARLTAVIIWCLKPRGAFSQIQGAAAQHRSPNAGWPEAATAFGLHIALSGPRWYHGHLSDDPFVNPRGRKNLSADDIDTTTALLWQTWAALLGLVLLISMLSAFF